MFNGPQFRERDSSRSPFQESGLVVEMLSAERLTFLLDMKFIRHTFHSYVKGERPGDILRVFDESLRL
ncbi:MAG: hypothetical protein NVSMB52_04100 [Chloroflexota bacterium]